MAVWILVVGMVAGQDAAPPPDVDDQEINQAIAELGDAKLSVRESASQRLWEAGLSAERALKIAAAGTDAESRFRARAILEKFRFGILPNTPRDVLHAIDNYRNGELKARVESVTVMAARGFHAQAEQLLRLDAAPDALLSAYVTQVALQHKLDERLAALNLRQDGEHGANIARIATMILRAKGDLAAAREMSLRCGDPVLQWGLAMEAADYPAAAGLFEQVRSIRPANIVNNTNQAETFRKIEQAGYVAALQYRAGNMAVAQTALEELQTLAQQNPSQSVYCAEPFFLSGNPESGLEMMKTAMPQAYFEMLTYQQKYKEAFSFLNVPLDGMLDDKWFESLPVPTNAAMTGDASSTSRFRLAGTAARILHGLGQKAAATSVIKQMGSQAEAAMQDNLWTLLAETEYRCGMLELAFGHAAKLTLTPDRAPILPALFGPARAGEAELWWWYFATTSPDDATEKTLERVHNMLRPAESIAEFEPLVARAIAQIKRLDESERPARLLALSDTCLAQNLPSLATSILEPLAASHFDAASRLGDIAEDKQDWEAAAKWLQLAWDLDTKKPAPLYLAGLALKKSGHEQDGQQFIERASMLAEQPATRHEMARVLARHGYVAEAIDAWEFVRRTAPLDEWAKFDSAKQIGDQIFSSEKLRAGDLWEQMMLSILRISWNFREYEGYLQMPAVISRVRAEAYARAGDWTALREQVEQHMRYAPADIRLAEEVVPLLDAAQQRPLGDELFQRMFDRFSTLCQEFPDSSLHHNNLAWLCARCRRQLDIGLTHAQRSVELAPRNAGHYDTLAEVHFQRGERMVAVELARKCLALDPRNKFYQTQLHRFETAPQPE